MYRRASFLTVALVLGCTDEPAKPTNKGGDPMVESEGEGESEDEHTDGARRFVWGVVIPTMQLVHESVDPVICPSGWTMLQQELALEGNGHLPPLQAAYVNRFGNLFEFARATIAAKTALGASIPVLRLSTVWPCWAASERWRNEMAQVAQDLIEAGWRIELTLLHHDSYPATLHNVGGFGLGGWSNNMAANAFAEYVRSVTTTLQGILPAGSRIYIANEPEALLFNGYLDQGGKWPPGGKNAGRSLAKAFFNMRTALREAALVVTRAGFEPAIAINVRPLLGSTGTEADRALEHLHNWWLLDALVNGCDDDNFSNACHNSTDPVSITIGLTFYGHMRTDDKTVELVDGVNMSLPVINVEPDADLFGHTLEDIYSAYGGDVGVAEIGFSSAVPYRMEQWLREYLSAAELALPTNTPSFIQLHTLFEGAEFSEGEWRFHLLDGCGDEEPCESTPWGMQVFEVISSSR